MPDLRELDKTPVKDVTEDVYERVHDVLQEVTNDAESKVSDLGAALVTKWVAVVELMDDEGNKWITGFRGPTPLACPTWDAKGLLMYCAQDLATLDEEDEDDA